MHAHPQVVIQQQVTAKEVAIGCESGFLRESALSSTDERYLLNVAATGKPPAVVDIQLHLQGQFDYAASASHLGSAGGGKLNTTNVSLILALVDATPTQPKVYMCSSPLSVLLAKSSKHARDRTLSA
eukprot:7395991-Pyramimonas_sp.AAC.1